MEVKLLLRRMHSTTYYASFCSTPNLLPSRNSSANQSEILISGIICRQFFQMIYFHSSLSCLERRLYRFGQYVFSARLSEFLQSPLFSLLIWVQKSLHRPAGTSAAVSLFFSVFQSPTETQKEKKNNNNIICLALYGGME
jgi:hypothetical protein